MSEILESLMRMLQVCRSGILVAFFSIQNTSVVYLRCTVCTSVAAQLHPAVLCFSFLPSTHLMLLFCEVDSYGIKFVPKETNKTS